MVTETRRYTNDEVSRIIRQALKAQLSDTIDHSELIDIGKEFGLDEDTIQTAIHDEQQRRLAEQKVQRKKRGFTAHLYSYIGVNSLLLLIDLMTPGPWWFQWSVLGWGIGLFFHYRALPTVSDQKK